MYSLKRLRDARGLWRSERQRLGEVLLDEGEEALLGAGALERRRLKNTDLELVQGYLAHKKQPPPRTLHLGAGTLQRSRLKQTELELVL